MACALCRALAKVEYNDNGCWVWKGALTLGYGRFNTTWNKSARIHRFMYEIFRGPIRDQLDHLCRNRACCNPWHLEDVNSRTNVLRGVGITAQFAKVTHCPKGHAYDESNTYTNPQGMRNCRTCRREYDRRRKALKRIER